MDSKLNTTTQSLAAATSFVGKNEVVNGYLNVICNLKTTKDCVITCEQSTNGTDYQFTEQFTHDFSVYGDVSRTQFAVKAYWVRISVLNATTDDIPKMVLTTLFSKQNKDASLEQPITIAGDVNVLNSMKATFTDNGVDTLKDVACDVNGVLKSNLVVEGISLTPATDGISVYGSTDQSVANAKLIKTDADGELIVNIDTKANVAVLEVSTPTTFAINTDITSPIDMIVGDITYPNITFSGQVSLIEPNPKIIMAFSDDNNAWVGDGVYANFYKIDAAHWTFNFQRSSVGHRFVKLIAQNATRINFCKSTLSM